MVVAESRFIVLQSTTSIQNSGLLDAILPIFKAETGIDVRVVAVGTGQALRNAENGDGDVVLIHAREAEVAFVAAGWGVERRDVMYNDFVLIGPDVDPAVVSGMTDIIAALRAIAEAEAIFVSRGDDSGTHMAERRFWQASGVEVPDASGTWYRETGAGMGATLNIGVGMRAYILTDRASWIAFGNKGTHHIMVEKDPRLFNQYGVIPVSPDRHPMVKVAEAMTFVDWLTGIPGQAAIAAFRLDGTQVFFPNASH